MTLTEVLQMMIALASGLGIGKLLEKREARNDNMVAFMQQQIDQSNQQWRNVLREMIETNHAEMMAELLAIKKAIGRGNRLIETGNHRDDHTR